MFAVRTRKQLAPEKMVYAYQIIVGNETAIRYPTYLIK